MTFLPICIIHAVFGLEVIPAAMKAPHLDGEEVHGAGAFPVGLEESVPGSLLATLRSRLEPVVFENVRNRRLADVVTEVPQRAPNAGVTPP
jgi:hypothetical protein